MWEWALRCHRRIKGGAKAGGVSKSKVVVSREELLGAQEGDVGAGGYVGRVETLFVRCISLGVHRQFGVELPAEEPEAVAQAGTMVGEDAVV